MSEQILKDIRKSIEANLPAEVGMALKARLQRLEDLETDFARMSERLSKSSAKCEQIDKELDGARKDIATYERQHEEIKLREEAVGSVERMLGIKLLEVKLEEAEKRADCIRDLALGFVRNPVLKYSGTTPVVIPGVPGSSADGVSVHYPTEPRVEDRHTSGESETE